MAGSGKTTFVQRVNSTLFGLKNRPYVLNLDPACAEVPFPVQIDIRKTVNYKGVMQKFGLGPNGAILTSLNLFATRFGSAVKGIEDRSKKSKLNYVLVDTPGQIEAFTWSASGAIITESLSTSFPTVIVYIVDTPRSTSPTTFMSNMLYACSIFYKTQLPMVVVFNKNDVVESDFLVEWMHDFEAFHDALRSAPTSGGYIDELTKSMSLVLDEFYKTLKVVSVSSMTGSGVDAFFEAVAQARQEYVTDYFPILKEKINSARQQELQRQQEQLWKLNQDLLTPDQPPTSS